MENDTNLKPHDYNVICMYGDKDITHRYLNEKMWDEPWRLRRKYPDITGDETWIDCKPPPDEYPIPFVDEMWEEVCEYSVGSPYPYENYTNQYTLYVDNYDQTISIEELLDITEKGTQDYEKSKNNWVVTWFDHIFIRCSTPPWEWKGGKKKFKNVFTKYVKCPTKRIPSIYSNYKPKHQGSKIINYRNSRSYV